MKPRARSMLHAAQHALAAGVRLDGEVAELDRLVHALGIALDDDERDRLPRELARDDLAHAAEAADDEVLVELVEHAFAAPPRSSAPGGRPPPDAP